MAGMRWLALVGLLALSCKTPAGSSSPPSPPETPAPVKEDRELAEAAARIDPGPQAPLYEVLPGWLRSKIEADAGGDPAAPERVAAAREAITAWDKVPSGDVQALLVGALQLGRGLVVAEQALAAGASDPELLAALCKAYRLVHQLEMFQSSGMFGQVLAMAVEIARKEGGLEGRQIEEAIEALKAAVKRAPALHMHTTARLLREFPDHPTVPEALSWAATARLDAEDYAEAVRLRELALARKGSRATGSDHADLVVTCIEALEMECADMARRTAEQLGPGTAEEGKVAAFKKRLADLDAAAERARRVIALRDATGLEEGYERGLLLVRLNRVSDAERTFSALREKFPQDARPLSGLAQVAIRRSVDFMRAAELIRQGRGLMGRDRLFYEIGLGTVPLIAISEISTRIARTGEQGAPTPEEIHAIIDEVEALAGEYRAFDLPRAALIELLCKFAHEAVPKFAAGKKDEGIAVLRGMAGEALELTRKFPDSPDAWRLLYSTVRLVADRAQAVALVTTPLPPVMQQDADVRLQQLRALLSLAVMWEDAAALAAAGEAAASLPTSLDADTAATLRATVDALAGRRGEAAAAQRALVAFAELAERKAGKEQALLLNNLGVMAALLGELQAAMTAFDRSIKADNSVPAALHNMAAVTFSVGALENVVEAFGVAGRDESPSALRLHARAWLVALAEAGLGDVKVTREEFAAALKKETEKEFRGRLPFGRWGVVEQGEFKVSLGYSTIHGLQLVDEVVSTWWLVLPAPGLDALLAGPAAKKPVKKR